MNCHRESFESRVSQNSYNSLWQIFPGSNYLPNEDVAKAKQALADAGNPVNDLIADRQGGSLAGYHKSRDPMEISHGVRAFGTHEMHLW